MNSTKHKIVPDGQTTTLVPRGIDPEKTFVNPVDLGCQRIAGAIRMKRSLSFLVAGEEPLPTLFCRKNRIHDPSFMRLL